MLVLEGQAQGFQIWGNVPDTTATGLAGPSRAQVPRLRAHRFIPHTAMRPQAIDWAG